MRTGALQTIAGIALLLLAFVGLAHDVEWIARPFYTWAWWGWILLLDGYCARRRGRSLLTTGRHLVLPIAIASVTFWFAFEGLNLRFRNWYYVGCYRLDTWVDVAACGLFVVSAFATVFVGIFETVDALGAAGLWRGWKGRARRCPGWASWAVQALGLTMATLAVLFPVWLAPLIWGSVSFLVDPWNYRAGRRSLLRDLERGAFGRVARIFAAGLLCGLVWESLNFIAPQKWIYTVRGLEGLKLFEMPLLGFLGFPALALDCVTVFAVFSWAVLGNETWEHAEDDAEPLPARPRRLRAFYLSVPLQVAIWAALAFGVMRTNVGSVAYGIDRLETLPASAVGRLEALELGRPRRLLQALRGPDRAEVLRVAGLDEDAARAVVEEIRLYEFKGLGPWSGRRLRAVGVERVEDLAAYSVDELYRELWTRAEEDGVYPPRLERVRVWVLASRDRGVWLSADDE